MGSCYGTCICCDYCDCGGGRGDRNCNCSGGGNDCGEAGLVILILVVVIIVFVAIFFAVRECGKHVSRIVAIVFLFLINVALTTLALYSGTDLYCILIAGFSSAAAVSNFLGILLPNIGCCAKLSYDYRYPLLPINQNPQLYLNLPYDQTANQTMVQSSVEPQFEKPFFGESYPESQEVMQVTTDKPTEPKSIYTEQNQDLDINGNAYDAPAPVYQEQNYNMNNNDNKDNMPMDNQYP